MIIFLGEFLYAAICLVFRTSKDLRAPAAELPPNASRGAAWVGLGIGLVLTIGMVWFGIAAITESSRPHGQYGTINGIAVSRADYEVCDGKIPDGCPGGFTGMINKYEAIRRARG